jgi:hypothetical protein
VSVNNDDKPATLTVCRILFVLVLRVGFDFKLFYLSVCYHDGVIVACGHPHLVMIWWLAATSPRVHNSVWNLVQNQRPRTTSSLRSAVRSSSRQAGALSKSGVRPPSPPATHHADVMSTDHASSTGEGHSVVLDGERASVHDDDAGERSVTPRSDQFSCNALD